MNQKDTEKHNKLTNEKLSTYIVTSFARFPNSVKAQAIYLSWLEKQRLVPTNVLADFVETGTAFNYSLGDDGIKNEDEVPALWKPLFNAYLRVHKEEWELKKMRANGNEAIARQAVFGNLHRELHSAYIYSQTLPDYNFDGISFIDDLIGRINSDTLVEHNKRFAFFNIIANIFNKNRDGNK